MEDLVMPGTQSTPTPPRLRQGDSASWSFTLPDYDGWALAYGLAGPGVASIACAGEPGGVFTASLPAATAANLAPGVYSWGLVATKGIERVTIADGSVVVLADPTAGGDLRTHARRVLDAIEAVIEGRATTDAQQLTIRSRTIAKTPISDLLVLRDRYRSEVAREEASAGGLPLRNKIFLRWAR